MIVRAILLVFIFALPVAAQDTQPEATDAMTLERLNEIVLALDPEALSDGRIWHFEINDTELLMVTDPANDRMRVLSPVGAADALTEADLLRMMQANFDTALDARYAIANGMLWSTFIHPMGALEKNQLISAIGQVVNLSSSYGTLYSGGALHFGGGDSAELQRQLIEDLLKKGEEI